MDDHLTICVFCGHEHAGTTDVCPSCGRAPIDQRLTPAGGEPVQLGFATDGPTPDDRPPDEPPPDDVPPRDEAMDDVATGDAATVGAAPDEAVPGAAAPHDKEPQVPQHAGEPDLPVAAAPQATHDEAAPSDPEPVDEEPAEPEGVVEDLPSEEEAALAAAMTAWPSEGLEWMDDEPAPEAPAPPPPEIEEPTAMIAAPAAQEPSVAGEPLAPPPPSADTSHDAGPIETPSPDESIPSESSSPEPGRDLVREPDDPRTDSEQLEPPTEREDKTAAEPPTPREEAPTELLVQPEEARPVAAAAASVRSRKGRSQSLVVALVVVAVVIGWFLVLNRISQEGDDTGTIEGSEVVVSTTGTPAAATTIAAATTAAPDDAAETTSPPTTAATTTTTTLAAVPDIEPIGDPIAIDDLGLGAFALGDLNFGESDALGRLVATFGAPDAYAPMDGAFGLCEGTAGFTTTWGPLTAVYSGTTEEPTFQGYRVTSDGGDHPAARLTTLSGLSAGNTVADLKSIYSSFIVTMEEVNGGNRFILTRGSDGRTLLWGPVSSLDDDGAVLGIYSPDACDGGPVPTP